MTKHGIDISQYQARWKNGAWDTINWDVAKLRGVEFAHLRLTSCEYSLTQRRMWFITDPTADEHAAGARHVGITTRGYSLLDYTGRYSPSFQARVAFNMLPDLSMYFADLERKYWWWPAMPSRMTCLAILKSWRDEMVKLAGVHRVGWYGNLDLYRKLQPFPAWLSAMPFWMAYWAQNAPSGVEWRWWQYTAKGNGAEYGAWSKSIDLNLELV